MKRVLVAEDETSIREFIVINLQRSGYEVSQADNGRAALEAYEAADGDFDVVLLDIMMPKKDGLEVLKALRENGVSTPVLILTAKAQVEDRIVGLDTGADDYLTKPFSMGELLARIRAITRRKSEFSPNLLSFSNLSLNRETYELSVGEESMRLGNKEFQMIEMLMRNPGRLISTEQFMERIWGYETEAEINVVWVYISYLRKKLAALHANISIKSSRNAGYSLEEEV